MDQNIKSEEDWSEELDHIPLKQRLNNLRASNQRLTRNLAMLVYLTLRRCILSIFFVFLVVFRCFCGFVFAARRLVWLLRRKMRRVCYR